MAIDEETTAKATSEDRIILWCNYCGQKYGFRASLVGKTGTCDRCQKHFIVPPVSQIEPELKKAIVFPCEDCGKALWEDEDLIGVKVQCSRCGKENIVSEKSKKTLTQKLESEELPNLPVAPKVQSTSSQKKQIVITDNPPTIHRVKNYFHKKTKKYFILFCTFAFAAIILLATWNFVMSESPEKNVGSRYNIKCRKCGHREVRRFKDITKQVCTKCNSPIGFTYNCKSCNKYFANNRTKIRKKKKLKKETSPDDPMSIECPFCHSKDTHYVTIRKTLSKKDKRTTE